MLSPELLELPGLDLGLVGRLLAQAPHEPARAADPHLEEIERIRFVVDAPPDAAGHPSQPTWSVGDGVLYCVAAGELEILESLERLVGALPARADDPTSSAVARPVEIEPALRPSGLRAQGAAIASRWLASTEGPLHLALSARALGFAVLSPYPAELGATLHALALQSPTFRPHDGWIEVLSGKLDRDLAAVLAEHLVRARPELSAERRAAEVSGGLELEDGPLSVQGRFRSVPGRAVDGALAPLLGPGLSLHLAAARSPLLLAELVRTVLEARRLASLSACFEDVAAPREVFTARVFSLADDALYPAACDPVSRLLIDHDVDSRASWTPGAGEWGLPIRLLRLTRRASALGDSHEPSALVGHRSWDLCRDDPREACAPLRAFRAALAAQIHGLTPSRPELSRVSIKGVARGK